MVEKRMLRGFVIILMMILTVSFLVAEESTEEGSGMDFGFDLGIGAETIGDTVYQTLTLSPDFAIGKFGVGIDITLHYTFTGGDGTEFTIYSGDWVPADAGLNFMELYLPKIRYVRYGLKGDPLFVKLGSIDDATLGNGFIMGEYANTLFLPTRRIFGLSFDMDGSLFKFPLLGIETFVDDLTAFDIIAARLYVRPLCFTEIPILKNLEVGTTLALDIDPYKYIDTPPEGSEDYSSTVFGFDFLLPILSNPVISLAGFGDIAFIGKQAEGSATGGMLGVGGRFFSFLPYGLQLRILGQNFIPVYFDSSYDLYRSAKYELVNSGNTYSDSSVGYYGSLGFSLLEDKIIFNVAIDGPFAPVPETLTENYLDYPHLQAVFILAEGLLAGFSFDASYEKKFIQDFASLIDATDAVIEANINYQTGPAVITLTYSLKYNPNAEGDDRWETTAGLKSSISLF